LYILCFDSLADSFFLKELIYSIV